MTHHEILLLTLGAEFGAYLTVLAYFAGQMASARRGRRAIEAAELHLAKREEA